MPDLNIVLAVIGTSAAIVSATIAFFTLRRTPKPKPEEQPFIPTCTTILGASMNHHFRDLPGYSPRRNAMGFGRRQDIG